MKTDLYTKIILTIIAACLFCIVAQFCIIVKKTSFISEVCTEKKAGKVDVNIVEIGGYDLSTTSPLIIPALPVKTKDN